MNVRAPVRSLRLGDPLRRSFLDELRRRVLLPRLLSAEWAIPKAEITVAVVDDGGPVLVLRAGELDGDARWVLRQPLDDFERGDLVDLRLTDLVHAGHPEEDARALAGEDAVELAHAVADAFERIASLRPEHARVPKALAAAIRDELAWIDVLPDDVPAEDGPSADEEDADGDGEDEPAVRVFSPPIDLSPPRPVAVRPRRRKRRILRALVWTVVLGGSAAAVTLAVGVDRDPVTAAGDTATDPTAAAGVVGDHSVQARNPDGTPVRFDPCRSYDFVVQPGSVPPDVAVAEVGAAFAAVEEASGVTFRYAGTSAVRFPHPIDATNAPGLPILVTYERPADSAVLRDSTHEGRTGLPLGGLAVGTPREVRPGLTVIVGGALVIDETLAPEQRARILLHELGHLVGLGHAGDPGQIMAPAVPESGPIAYRDGDRAGFAEVGSSSGCALTDAERASVFG